MKVLILLLFLTSLFELSLQIGCNTFEDTEPSQYDLVKIKKAVLRQRPSILVDYDPEDLDGACYEGVSEKNPSYVAEELFERINVPYQTHKVKTADGYVLTLHRIQGRGKPVILDHGLFGSSIDWLLLGENSLPYLLSAKGFDVWMTNARGNHFSNQHESLSTNCQEFWDFSFDEIGFYDLPAAIDYILSNTGQSALSYIGYSQGTTAFFVMASLREEYNQKVSSVIALAPMVYMSKAKSPLLRAFAFNEMVLASFGKYKFAPSGTLSDTLSNVLCNSGSVLCNKVPFLMCGFDRTHIDASVVPDIAHEFSAEVSSKLIHHYAQGVYTGQFKRFDYEKSRLNINKYESLSSPDYSIDSLNLKLTVFYSDNDWLSNSSDVQELKYSLYDDEEKGNFILVQGYSHLDYLWASDARVKVYEKVVDLV